MRLLDGVFFSCLANLLQFVLDSGFREETSLPPPPPSGRFSTELTRLLQVYRYMNRGLYERDKMLFKLLVTLKIMTVASQSLREQ